MPAVMRTEGQTDLWVRHFDEKRQGKTGIAKEIMDSIAAGLMDGTDASTAASISEDVPEEPPVKRSKSVFERRQMAREAAAAKAATEANQSAASSSPG